MTTRNFTKYTIALIISNLTLGFICSATTYANGDVTIENCSTDCLSLEIPTEINDHKTHWINNLESNIRIIQNPSLKERIMVNDIRNGGSGWQLEVSSSNLTNGSQPNQKIAYTNIGILTFNQSNTYSVDSTIGTPKGVEGLLDKNFSFQQLNESVDQDEFTYFPSSANPDQSTAIVIMTGDSTPKNESLYTSLGLNIIIPPDSNLLLKDGHYLFEMTFTLNVL